MRYLLILFCCFSLLLFSTYPAFSLDENLHKALALYVQKNSPIRKAKAIIGVEVADAATGDVIYANNSEKLMTPASILKIITSYAALKVLGSEYRFPSEVFVDNLPFASKSKGNVGNLYFRGYGDPSLISERLWEISQFIKNEGVLIVDNVVIDDTLFIDPTPPEGPRPYEAGLSATSLNFNSYGVSVAPGPVGELAVVNFLPALGLNLDNQVSTRSRARTNYNVYQSPSSRGYIFHTNSSVSNNGTSSPLQFSTPVEMKITVRGNIGQNPEPIVQYYSVPHPPSYLGFALKKLLEQQGIMVAGNVLIGESNKSAKLLHVFKSKNLVQIMRDLNQYSNNFIAGQLLFALGQDSGGYYRIDTAIDKVGQVLEEIGISRDSYKMVDGSGLGRENQFTPKQLTKVLSSIYQDFSIAPDFISSLSRFGSTGTLRKRYLAATSRGRFGNRNRSRGGQIDSQYSQRASGVWGKTGTLNSVSSLAGFAKTGNGRIIAYTIITNGRLSKADSKQFENGLVKVIIGTNGSLLG